MSVSVPFWRPSTQVASVVVVELEVVVETDVVVEVEVVVLTVDEAVLAVVDVVVEVEVVLGAPGHGPGAPFLSFRLKARPPACTLCVIVLPLPTE
jgi:hypothetical protein